MKLLYKDFFEYCDLEDCRHWKKCGVAVTEELRELERSMKAGGEDVEIGIRRNRSCYEQKEVDDDNQE